MGRGAYGGENARSAGGSDRCWSGSSKFVEWTPDGHLWHSRYMGLREDKSPREVTRDPGLAEGRTKDEI